MFFQTGMSVADRARQSRFQFQERYPQAVLYMSTQREATRDLSRFSLIIVYSSKPFTNKAAELERDIRQYARNATEATVFTQHKKLTALLRMAIGVAKDKL